MTYNYIQAYTSNHKFSRLVKLEKESCTINTLPPSLTNTETTLQLELRTPSGD